MKHLKTILLFIVTSSLLMGQECDNFIKIVGQSAVTVQSNGISTKFTIEEVERNEYQKIQARTLEDVKADLETHLKTLGYTKNDLEENLPNSGYNNKLGENYTMIFKNIDDLKEFKQAAFSGFKISEVQYAFDTSNEVDDKKLAEQAIQDARRKAEALAKNVGKSVGKVISIHDRSYSSLKVPETSRSSEYIMKYEITISFELLN